jgi:hypothetical protein
MCSSKQHSRDYPQRRVNEGSSFACAVCRGGGGCEQLPSLSSMLQFRGVSESFQLLAPITQARFSLNSWISNAAALRHSPLLEAHLLFLSVWRGLTRAPTCLGCCNLRDDIQLSMSQQLTVACVDNS